MVFLAAALLMGQLAPVPMEPVTESVEIAESETGTVILQITGFESNDGSAVVALFTEDEWSMPPSPDRAAVLLEAPIVGQAVNLEVPGIPYGSYVAMAFHDEDDDGEPDMGDESIGHSGALPRMSSTERPGGPPSFDDLCFDIDGPVEVVRITVRQMEAPGAMPGGGGPGGVGPGGGGPGGGSGGGPGGGGPPGGF